MSNFNLAAAADLSPQKAAALAGPLFFAGRRDQSATTPEPTQLAAPAAIERAPGAAMSLWFGIALLIALTAIAAAVCLGAAIVHAANLGWL